MPKGLNPPSGNMYPGFHTVNPISGCTAHCSYCYNLRSGHPVDMTVQLHLDRLSNWGYDKSIFVGSAGDMWGKTVKSEWISLVLAHCNIYHQNTYLFQSKNPSRFEEFTTKFPPDTILGTTVETNDMEAYKGISAADLPLKRLSDFSIYHEMKDDLFMFPNGFPTLMISIEPVMKFNNAFMSQLRSAMPDYISVGGDSKSCGLLEPMPDDIIWLVTGCREFTEVRIKGNLERIIGDKIFNELKGG